MAEDFFGTTITEEACDECPPVVSPCSDPLNDDPSCTPTAVVALSVEPEHGTTDIGSDFPFRAFALFSDGRIRDVSEEATWTSSAPVIAIHRGDGVFSALDAGEISAVANWNGYQDSGRLTVLAPCRDIPLDAILVIERSGWMTDDIWRAARNFVYALRLAGKPWVDPRPNLDRVAIIHFAETPEIVQEFTNLLPASGILNVTGEPIPSYRAAPGRGLETAYHLLQREARPNARQLVVIVMSGLEADCVPGVRDMATLMKQNSVIVAAIGGRPKPRVIRGWHGETRVLNIGSGIDCDNGGSIEATHIIEQTASPGMAFLAESVGDIMTVVSQIPSSTCGNFDGTGMPTYDPENPTGPPVVDPPLCQPPNTVTVFESSYAWAINSDQNPNTLLTGEQLARANCIFSQEVSNFLRGQAEAGIGVTVFGAPKWIAYTLASGGAYFSGIRKSTCDPEDGIDDWPIGGGQIQVLAIAICQEPV